MKKLVLGILLYMSVFPTGDTYAQNNTLNPKVKELFGNSLNYYVDNHPQIVNAYNTLLSRIYVEKYNGVIDTFKFLPLSQQPVLNKFNPDLSRDSVFNLSTFNPLKYDLTFFDGRGTHSYWIDGTDYVIIIYKQPLGNK